MSKNNSYTGKEALGGVDVLDPLTKGVNQNSIFVDTGGLK